MRKPATAFKSPEGMAALHQYAEGLLAHWMEPREMTFVETRYGRAHVIACGPIGGPAVVLLHGSAMSSLMWMGDAPVFARTHRVYAVDLPGEPGMSDERRLPFAGAEYAYWLHDVFAALGLSKASIVGISLGAWLAVKFAAQYPEMVDQLALLSPAGIGTQKVSFLLSGALFSLLGDGMRRRLVPKVNGPQELPEVVLQYQRLIDEHFNYRRELLPLFHSDELKRLVMPVLAYAGGKDAMFHTGHTAKRWQGSCPMPISVCCRRPVMC